MSNTVERSEDSEVAHCVSNLIHAFANGLDIFKRLRERRRKKKDRKHRNASDHASRAELKLSNSLRRGPTEIQRSYDDCYSKAGARFARGDAVAHASLAETLIKLNTGLVSIITAFLNPDTKPSHLKLDFKSLTNLSDASRAEAIDSLYQLYERLSHSQLQLYKVGHCPRRSSGKHQNCTGEVNELPSEPKPRHDKVKKTGSSTGKRTSRSTSSGPTIARVTVKKSRGTQLAVIRPRNNGKSSSSSSASSKLSSGSSTSSKSSQSTALSSPYTTPMESPLPQYTPMDPFLVQKLPIARAPPNLAPGRRRSSTDNQRPTTWPHTNPNTLPLPTIRPPPPTPPPPPPVPPKFLLPSTHKSALPHTHHTPAPSPCVGPSRRRADKPTPSTYTFASDSTKLGEIPQRNWNVPWNYEEAERLNEQARLQGYGMPTSEATRPKGKKGIFGFLRRGTA